MSAGEKKEKKLAIRPRKERREGGGRSVLVVLLEKGKVFCRGCHCIPSHPSPERAAPPSIHPGQSYFHTSILLYYLSIMLLCCPPFISYPSFVIEREEHKEEEGNERSKAPRPLIGHHPSQCT